MTTSNRTPPASTSRDLLAYLDASPSPFHCVEESKRRLDEAGFTQLFEQDPWQPAPGKAYYMVRGDGSLLAFRTGQRPPAEAGFRIIGAHTDAPSLRPKPNLAKTGGGYLLLDVEVYGGPILATWTDRDLGLAGRIVVDDDEGISTHLVRIDRPLCRLSNIAIHLDREVNEKGLSLDRHQHLAPALSVWNGRGDPGAVVLEMIAEAAGVPSASIRGHDLCLYDLQPATVGGISDDFVYSGRLDDVAMCHAALTALLRAGDSSDHTKVIALFDHEEVGSLSARGAAGSLLPDLLQRLVDSEPREGGLGRAMARSMLISADMAHGLHPNRPDRHDGSHLPRLNGGPVIKTNANQRYATDGETAAVFRRLCRKAEVPVQEFAMRADLPCGSSIGPTAAAALGVRTVDVGNPILSMHSIREVCGSRDAELMTRALELFLGDPELS